MTDSGGIRRRKLHRRRWLAILAGLAVCLALAWATVEYVINVNRYKPLVEAAIEKKTGLPATIGGLDLDLVPLPRLQVFDVHVGQPGFEASAREVEAYIQPWGLLSQRISVTDVVVRGALAIIPTDLSVLPEKWSAVFTQGSAAETKTFDISVARVRAMGAKLYRGSNATPIVVLNADVRDPLSDTISVTVSAALPQVEPSPRIQASLTLVRSGTPRNISTITGAARLAGLDFSELMDGPQAPKARLTAEVKVEGKGPWDITLDISGKVIPDSGEPPAVQALAGPFTTKAWWRDGKLIVNDLQWNAPGLTLAGDMTRSPNGEIAARVSRALFNEASLAPLFAMLPTQQIHLEARPGATLEAGNLLLGRTPEGQFRFVKGDISLARIDAGVAGRRGTVTNVAGDLSVNEGVVQVKRLTADGMSLTGTVHPDLAARTVALDLSGRIELSRDRLSPFLPLQSVTQVEGNVVLKRIVATVVPGEGIPKDLVIEGSLTKGKFTVDSPQFADTFSGITADFVTRPEAIETKARGVSEKMGPITCEGDYRFADAAWKGAVALDVRHAATSFIKSENLKTKVSPVLALYGGSPLNVACALPSAKSAGGSIAITRTDQPVFEGSIEWVSRKEGLALGQVSASTALPMSAFAQFLPAQAALSGTVPISFTRLAQDQTFRAVADLTHCSVAVGSYFEKKTGGVAGVEVTGQAAPGVWVAHTLTVNLLGEQARATLAGGNAVFDKLDVNLASLSALLPAGGKASGRVIGAVETAPPTADLALSDAGIALSPELAIDSANGRISLARGQWSIRDLRVLGANSECVINGGQTASGWRGTLTGAKLDLNAIQTLAEHAKAFAAKAESQGTAAPQKPFTGECAVDMDALYYRRARLDHVHAVVQMRDSAIRVRNLKAQPHSGWVTGTIDLVKASSATPAYSDVDLDLDGVDARILDELSPREPREFTGTISGKVRLRLPTGEGIDPINGATGTMHITARDGSLGKMGFATKTLAVLRTTEIVRLRLPSLKDKGLVYDTLDCALRLDNGFMTVEQFNLANTSMALHAQGTVDFPKLATDMRIRIRLLEAVRGIVTSVPVLGRAVNEVTKEGGLLLVATGSPYDPHIRFGGAGTTQAVADEVTGAAKEGGKAIRDTIKDTAADALNKLLGK